MTTNEDDNQTDDFPSLELGTEIRLGAGNFTRYEEDNQTSDFTFVQWSFLEISPEKPFSLDWGADRIYGSVVFPKKDSHRSVVFPKKVLNKNQRK